MITGKEAKQAWASGAEVDFTKDGSEWIRIKGGNRLDIFENTHYQFRLKPRTITINGIEVPAPFEPKGGDFYYCMSPFDACGYAKHEKEGNYGYGFDQFGAWRSEDEIIQVVAALRSIFST